MNLSIGIKNSILVLLIILIIHIILKNMKSSENYDNCNPIKEKPFNFDKEKTLVANCDIKQDKKNMMIIHEYEEDKNKDPVDAFDDFDINYEYYLQAEKAADKINLGSQEDTNTFISC